MRSPSRPNSQDLKVSDASPVGRDPSYPDRQRIDSDVRAFMRPVSTPWIVFDRDSRVDFGKVAIRAGVGFVSTPDFRKSSVELPPGPMFPTSSDAKPVEEPSSLIVATDVVPPEEITAAKPSRMGFFALTAGIVGIAAGAAFAFTHAPAPVNAVATLAVAHSDVPSDRSATPPLGAPALTPATSPVVVEAPAAAPVVEEAPAPAAVPAEEVGEKATDPKKRFGHLTIKGDASKGKQVWFDSKRMLGKGERSFLVFCGMHQMAITDGATTRVTADTLAKDVEVPCNGDLVVGK